LNFWPILGTGVAGAWPNANFPALELLSDDRYDNYDLKYLVIPREKALNLSF
jgi:hypothetical protein